MNRGAETAFRAEIHALKSNAKTDEQRANAFLIAAKILLEDEQPERALVELDHAENDFPAQRNKILRTRVVILRDLERYDEAVTIVNERMRDSELDRLTTLYWVILRIELMDEMNRWQDWSQIQTQVRRFLREMTDLEERESAVASLTEACMDNAKADYFKVALVYLDLALLLKPKDPSLLQLRRKLETQERMAREMDRLLDDDRIIPLVRHSALTWASEETADEEDDEELAELNQMLASLLDQQSQFHEEIAADILQLRALSHHLQALSGTLG